MDALGGGHTAFFFTYSTSTEGLLLYTVVLEAGGGQTLLVLGIGDGAYFFGLSFPATFASQACFMELASAELP